MVAYIVETPAHILLLEQEEDESKRLLKFPKCDGRPAYAERFHHAHTCYPKHGVAVGEVRTEATSPIVVETEEQFTL